MTRRTVALIVSSHLILAMVGGGLAWWSVGHGNATGRHGAVKSPEAALRVGDAGAGSRRAASWQSSEFARAWKAVRERRATTRERIQLQRDLLAAWAAVDLRAAVEAALDEAWDHDDGDYYDPYGPLLGALSPAFAQNPQAGWEMIRGRPFGVGTGMVRRVWMEAAGVADPLFLAGLLGKLSWREREPALEILHEAMPHLAAKGNLFAALSRQPAEVVDAAQLVRFAPLPTTDLAAGQREITRLAAVDPRLAMVQAILFGKALAGVPVSEIETELAALPEDFRVEAAWAGFLDARDAGHVLAFADWLVTAEAWEKLAQRETTAKIDATARGGDAAVVAAWATELPVRVETRDLFRHGVEGFLVADSAAAREWLVGLPAGVWRDRGYAEFSVISLLRHRDEAASRWAIDQIESDDIRAEAEDRLKLPGAKVEEMPQPTKE